jgi:hypothetical protein
MLTPLAEDINELLEIKAIDPLHILQTIDSPPQYLTMLVDPRGSVHVTSGLLPTKTITLPPEDYAPALETIEVSFLTTPILTESGTRSLPLPSEPGFDWTWLEHNRWLNKDIFKESLQAQNQGGQFSDSEAMDTLWDRLQAPDIAWIKPRGEGKKARIVPMGRRKSEQLDVITQEEFKSQIAQLEPDYSEHGDEIWNYLLDPKVQWLRSWKNPESSEQIPPVEIVPKHLRRSRYLHPLPDSLDSFNASELADHIERLFSNYLNQTLSDVWTTFGIENRGESISRLEDHIEQLFWSDYTTAPIIERETFFTELAKIEKGETQPLEKPFSDSPLARQVMWDFLLDKRVSWLKTFTADPTRAIVLTKDQRRMEVLSPQDLNPGLKLLSSLWFPELQGKIELILEAEALEISAINTKANFSKALEIREGWLILKPSDKGR